ncbi:MAG: hypothetical protein IKP95_02500 [Ruminococcus sp.]|nr:hypothetical protein [Ruminococcus sp.]
MSRLKILVLVIALLGIFMGVTGMSDAFTIMGDKAIKLEETKVGSLSIGDLAKGEIDGALDEIAVEKTSRSYGFIPMGSSETPYYLVHINDHYSVLSAGDKDIQNKINSLAARTWEFFEGNVESIGDGVAVEAKVIAMPEKVKGFLKDYCNELEFTDADYAELVDDSVVINVVQYNTMKIIPFVGLGVGVLALVGFIIMLIKSKKN